MKIIYKYVLWTGDNVIKIPRGAIIRHIGDQFGSLMLWCEIDLNETKLEERRLPVFATGEEFDDGGLIHIRTVISSGGRYIWHVYEDTNWKGNNG